MTNGQQPVVVLTPWEIMLGGIAGVMRQVENLKAGRTPYHGAGKENDWQLHIEGCLGEYALAKYLGLTWIGKGNLRAPDVGSVDVRTSSHPNCSLILHKEDPDDRVFWLVKGVNGRYEIMGWIKGIDGKIDAYWGDPKGGRPAYFVPSTVLNPPDKR